MRSNPCRTSTVGSTGRATAAIWLCASSIPTAAGAVAALVLAEQGKAGQGKAALAIETLGGLLEARAAEGGAVEVDMGPPRFAWDAVPLAREMDTLHLDLSYAAAKGPTLSDPIAVNIGNPHVIFFVDDPDAYDLTDVGKNS